MLHKAWSSIEEVPYCFWRSSVKFQGHTALKIIKFDPNWVFPDCNSSLNSPMAMKCCTKLETAKERCPIVFQGHPSNFKVTRYKTSPILTQIGHFPTVGRSQLSNPSDLPCLVILRNDVFINWLNYSDIISASWHPKSLSILLFVQQLAHTDNKTHRRATFEAHCEGNHQQLLDSPNQDPIIWKVFPCHNITLVWIEPWLAASVVNYGISNTIVLEIP